jgi:hypothetical protein
VKSVAMSCPKSIKTDQAGHQLVLKGDAVDTNAMIRNSADARGPDAELIVP